MFAMILGVALIVGGILGCAFVLGVSPNWPLGRPAPEPIRTHPESMYSNTRQARADLAALRAHPDLRDLSDSMEG